MNLRILKKLSKRAAVLLKSGQAPLTRHRASIYACKKWEGYTESYGHDRKHWDRRHSLHSDDFGETYLVLTPRHGKGWIKLSEPNNALKGTMMAGWESCGMDFSEWEEHTAWEELLQRIGDVFTDFIQVPNDDEDCLTGYDIVPVWSRKFPNPSAVFRAVPDMLAECRRQEAEREQRWKNREAA